MQRVAAPQLANALESSESIPQSNTVEWIAFDPSSVGLNRARGSLAIETDTNPPVVWLKISPGGGNPLSWSALSTGGGGGAPTFTQTTGTVAAGKLTAVANATVVQVTNAGSDSFIQLLDLGVAPTLNQIAIISLAPASGAGYDILTGGTPTGTAKAFAGPSSVAEANQSIWAVYNGTEWVPLLAGLSAAIVNLTGSLIAGNEVVAQTDVVGTQLVQAGAVRVQATILTTSVGTGATIDLDVTDEDVTQRLFLNAQSSAGSITNIINSFRPPIAGQTLEIINTSQFAVSLSNASGGVGQIAIPSYSGQESGAELAILPGQMVVLDYDTGNELGFGVNTWVVMGATGDPRVSDGAINIVAGVTLTAQHVGDTSVVVIVGGVVAPTHLDLGYSPLAGTVARIASAFSSSATMTITTGSGISGTSFPMTAQTAGLALTAGQVATAIFNGATWNVYR